MFYSDLPRLVKRSISSNQCVKPGRVRDNVDNVELMQETIDKLQSEKDTLMNTVSDLKQLISRLSIEHAKEAESHLASMKAYANKIARMQKALEAAEKNAGHFDDIKDFWGEIVNK